MIYGVIYLKYQIILYQKNKKLINIQRILIEKQSFSIDF